MLADENLITPPDLSVAKAKPLPTPPPVNIQVNQADHNSGTLGDFTSETETSIAVSGSTVVVGYTTSKSAGLTDASSADSFTGFGFSTDGGASFTDAGFLNPPLGLRNFGSPSLATDSAGNIYFASEAMHRTTGAASLVVAKSTSISPVTFGTPIIISDPFPPSVGAQDREVIAIDTTGGAFNDRVYVAWADRDNGSRVLFNRSTSISPLAFATPVTLSTAADMSSPDVFLSGAMPTIGINGEVYVIYGRLLFSATSGSLTGESIHLLKSTDGGVNFFNPDSADPAPSKVVAQPTPGPINLGDGSTTSVPTFHYPHIVVDRTPAGSPTRGNLYIVFQADPDGTGTDRSDIFFTRSTDGGVSWSVPRSINTGTGVQSGADPTTNDNWQPSISVSPVNGQITVIFYDRRSDPANNDITVFRAVSTDAGYNWFDEPISSAAFAPSTAFDPFFEDLMGLYIHTVASGSNVHYAWGDLRNTCAPPLGAVDPCSPTGRRDKDVFYASSPLITGPDLAITPWGDATGVGPQWKSPDIFVVDAANIEVNAAKGVVNQLRARVRNLGNATATGAVIRFKYAPIFAGLTEGAMRTIGTVTQDFAAAGDSSGNDLHVVPIPWDLTNLGDTNGGQWPMPVSAFDHFCVRVSVEFPSDVNLSNNSAQTNFFDVQIPHGSGGSMAAIHFMIGNPSPEHAANAQLLVDLPGGFTATFCGDDSPLQPGVTFNLKPKEVRVATVNFISPAGFESNRHDDDVIGNISLKINGRVVGGLSARFALGAHPTRVLSAADEQRLQVAQRMRGAQRLANENPMDRQAQEGVDNQKPGGVTQVFPVTPDMAYKAILSVLSDKKEAVGLTDESRGLIKLKPIRINADQLRQYATGERARLISDRGGRLILVFRIEGLGNQTRVIVSSLIIVDRPKGTLLGGMPVPSNETLEKSYLDSIAGALAKP
ncbi:MAG TPA: sialidase family protein [Pyrinomonadaceae bacterium]